MAEVSKSTFTQRFHIFQALLIAAISSSLTLTVLAKIYPFFIFDLPITRAIQSINLPLFDSLMKFLTWLGTETTGGLLVLFFSLLFFLTGRKKDGLLIFISSFGVAAIGIVIKNLVARPRPGPSLITQIGHFNRPDSFPSGHVLFYIGLFGYLLFLAATKLKKGFLKTSLLLVNCSLIILIGVSRIYLGAHWFSDTLGSYMIGIIWLYFIIYLHRKWKSL